MPKLPRVLDLVAKYNLKCSGYVDEMMKLMRARMTVLLMLTLVLMFASMMAVMNMTTQALRFIEA